MPTPHFTVAEYLRRERDSTDRHEYWDGELLMMAGGTVAHSRILVNIYRALGNRLAGKPCQPFDSNLRVRVPRPRVYVYPDASVVCGPVELDPDDVSGGTITNPRLVLEVLSPSTEMHDRGLKFSHYRELPSLTEYVLVAQDRPLIETFFRQGDGAWLLTPVAGLEAVARLRSLELGLPLAEVYAGVELPAAHGV